MTNDYIHSGNDCIHIARAEIRPVGTFSNKVGTILFGARRTLPTVIEIRLTAVNNDSYSKALLFSYPYKC